MWNTLTRRQSIAAALLFGIASNADAHQVETWSDNVFFLFTAAALLLSAVLYGVGTTKLRRRARPMPPTRIAAFAAGCITLAVALLSPLDRWGEQAFWLHMVQHELLMLVGAPLVVFGRPLAAFAAAAPRAWRHVSSWPDAWKVVTSPLMAWSFHALVIWVWHVPRLFDASVANPWTHAMQHATFLISALIFWYALLIAQHRPMTMVYLLTTAIHTGTLGALITFAPVPLYHAYSQTTALWGVTPLEDQQLGGLMMWVPAGLWFVLAGLFLFNRWLDAASRRAHT